MYCALALGDVALSWPVAKAEGARCRLVSCWFGELATRLFSSRARTEKIRGIFPGYTKFLPLVLQVGLRICTITAGRAPPPRQTV